MRGQAWRLAVAERLVSEGLQRRGRRRSRARERAVAGRRRRRRQQRPGGGGGGGAPPGGDDGAVYDRSSRWWRGECPTTSRTASTSARSSSSTARTCSSRRWWRATSAPAWQNHLRRRHWRLRRDARCRRRRVLAEAAGAGAAARRGAGGRGALVDGLLDAREPFEATAEATTAAPGGGRGMPMCKRLKRAGADPSVVVLLQLGALARRVPDRAHLEVRYLFQDTPVSFD